MKKSMVILMLAGAILGGCTALEKTSSTAEKVSNTTADVNQKINSVQEAAQFLADLNSIKGKEFTLENSDITITFDLTKVYGFSGVNRYFGGMKVEGTKVSFTNLASTMMAGPADKMQAENDYLKALGSVNKMVISGNAISLIGEGKTLNFIAK